MKMQRTHENRAVRWLSTIVLFGAILTMLCPAGAWAVGTPANTGITNRATINYDVGGATIVIESSPTGNATTGANNGADTSFVVDQMVDLVVTRAGGAYTPAAAGSTTAVLTYSVANTGNDTFDFNLNALDIDGLADPYGGADNLNGVVVTGIFVDSDPAGPTGGGTPYSPAAHSYAVGTDTATFVDDLAQDQMINVYIVCTIPGTAVNGDIAVMLLRAEARRASDTADLTATVGGDTPGMDIVFVDADGDGAGPQDADRNSEHVAVDAFQIQAPSLTVTKTSQVQEDPFNGTTNPMAIPLARVRYTITIANGGASAANNIVVTDAIPGSTWFYVGSVTGGTGTYSDDNGSTYTYGPSAGSNGEDQNVTNIQVDVGSIAASANATVTFDVIIQ